MHPHSLLFSLFSLLLTPLAFSSTSLDPHLQQCRRCIDPQTREALLCLWISYMLLPSPGMPRLCLLPNCLQPATRSPGLSVSTVSLSVPSLTQWSFPGVSLNLALTSFKGMIRRHCNWLFSCLPLLRLWALRWQRAFGNACGLNSTWLEWGFNDWFLNMWFTHWGHWGKSEEKSHPPNSSTTELWDFYKLFSFHVAVFSFIK